MLSCRANCKFNIQAPFIIRLRRAYGATGIMSHGDRREKIFLDDVDRQDFLKTLAETCQKTGFGGPIAPGNDAVAKVDCGACPVRDIEKCPSESAPVDAKQSAYRSIGF